MPRRHPPRPYDPAIGAAVVARIEAGELLRDLWRDPALPGRFTLKRWRHENPEFSRAVRAAVDRARSRTYLAKWYGPSHRSAILRLAETGMPLRAIAAEPGMPGLVAIHHWLNTEPDFRWAYAAARELMAEGLHAGARGVLAEAVDRQSAREIGPRLRNLLDQRLLPRKHNLYQLILEAQTARTGLCPCRDCKVERYWARLRAEGAAGG